MVQPMKSGPQVTLGTFEGVDVEMRTVLISNRGFQDLSPGAPDYTTQMQLGAFLPADHRQASLHNRKRVLTDYDRLVMYGRGGITKVIVDDPATDTWLDGVRFEDEALNTVVGKVWPVIEESVEIADIWAGVFGMGFVVLGYNDGKAISEPLDRADDVLWAEGFSRTHITEVIYDNVVGSPTYREAKALRIRVGKPGEDGGSEESIVHCDRILFITRNKHIHPFIGGSDLDKPFNDLEDGLGIAWANAESYYSGASPKMVLKTMRPLTKPQEQQVDQQLKEMQSNLRQLAKMLHSMDLQKLTSGADVAKPLEHVVAVFTFLAASTGVPFSKWVKHHLSAGDALDWANREWDEFIGKRRRRFGNRVVRRLLLNLSKAGMVEKAKVLLKPIWTSPRTVTREDTGRTARNESTAVATSVQGAGMVHKELAGHFIPVPPETLKILAQMNPKPADGKQTAEDTTGSSRKANSKEDEDGG